MKIYIIRHGQTDLNKQHRAQGRKGLPLNEDGLTQANLLGQNLKDIKFDAIFSSPQERALQTARLASGQEPIVDNRLNVYDLGSADNLLYSEIKMVGNIPDPEIYAGVEEPNAFVKRLNSFINDLIKQFGNTNKNILVCGHKCTSGYICAYFENKLCCEDFLKFSPSNGKYSVIDTTNFEATTKAELSIRKKFHKELFSNFCKAINDYKMVEPNDKIAVCISGGKDSMLMAKLFQELKRHNKFLFDLVFLVMDPGYSKANRQKIENNAKLLGIDLTVFETEIFDSVTHIEKSPCYICARMRRGHLYNKAKQLGCNKIALGHHFNDVIETILMGMLYGAQVQTMMPKLKSSNFEGMELIRPMYYIKEKDIIHFAKYNNLEFIACACKFTEQCKEQCLEDKEESSKRKKVKQIIAKLAEKDPQIEQNIFKSVENVNLSTIIAFKDKHGKKHNFVDEY